MPGRALQATVALFVSGVVSLFLFIGGSILREPPFGGSATLPERIIGTLMVVAGLALWIAGPLAVLILRRTTAWKVATVVATVTAAWAALVTFFGIL